VLVLVPAVGALQGLSIARRGDLPAPQRAGIDDGLPTASASAGLPLPVTTGWFTRSTTGTVLRAWTAEAIRSMPSNAKRLRKIFSIVPPVSVF
jgi:hypothetical protein